jgi:hypothetical protein
MEFCMMIYLQSKNQKYEHGGQLKVKIHILLYGENSSTTNLDD